MKSRTAAFARDTLKTLGSRIQQGVQQIAELNSNARRSDAALATARQAVARLEGELADANRRAVSAPSTQSGAGGAAAPSGPVVPQAVYDKLRNECSDLQRRLADAERDRDAAVAAKNKAESAMMYQDQQLNQARRQAAAQPQQHAGSAAAAALAAATNAIPVQSIGAHAVAGRSFGSGGDDDYGGLRRRRGRRRSRRHRRAHRRWPAARAPHGGAVRRSARERVRARDAAADVCGAAAQP